MVPGGRPSARRRHGHKSDARGNAARRLHGAMGAGASADDPETPAGLCRGGQRGALCADLLRQPLRAEGLRSGGAAAHDERVARAAHTKGGWRGRTGRRGYDDAGPSGRGERRAQLSGAASGLPGAGGGHGGRPSAASATCRSSARSQSSPTGRHTSTETPPRRRSRWRSWVQTRSASTAPPGRISWKAWCG